MSRSDLVEVFVQAARASLEVSTAPSSPGGQFVESIPMLLASRYNDLRGDRIDQERASTEGAALGARIATMSLEDQVSLLEEESVFEARHAALLKHREGLLSVFMEGVAQGFASVHRQPGVPADLLEKIPATLAESARARSDGFDMADDVRMRGVWSGVGLAQLTPSRLAEVMAFEKTALEAQVPATAEPQSAVKPVPVKTAPSAKLSR